MVGKNTVLHETQFTVSVDLLKDGVTTGISAQDRAKTIQALIDPATRPEDLGKPGHIFPLKAKNGGVILLVLITQKMGCCHLAKRQLTGKLVCF